MQLWIYGEDSSLLVFKLPVLNPPAYAFAYDRFEGQPIWRLKRVAIGEHFPYQVNNIIEEIPVMLTVVVLFASSILLIACVAGSQVG